MFRIGSILRRYLAQKLFYQTKYVSHRKLSNYNSTKIPEKNAKNFILSNKQKSEFMTHL